MKARLAKSIALLPLWQVDALAAALMCVGAGVWYFAGFAPLVEARAARQQVETELADENEALHQKGDQIKTLEASLEKARAQTTASQVHLQPVDHINQQVQKLTRMATEAGLKFDEIKPAAPVPQERFTTVPIKVSGSGAYSAVTEFLGRLRSDFHDTGVSGFSLKGTPDDLTLGLKFELNLVWYADAQPVRVEKKKP